MEKSKFYEAESVKSATVDAIQKEKIIEAILQSIKNCNYYDGLEISACKAISNINKFSDAEIKSELKDEAGTDLSGFN
ncbi:MULTISPECIES: hypothetical protein [Rodentibacter]|uniref:Uncharacterized protein n=1 Tax=Rodentibacter mrazii TaxID=1908257 RepID=A0A1V3IEM2_9PAST|nr:MULTISPECIES: hypothetical protein [Rodentibacter]OOF39058.1 hypothetical protein BKK47_07520 [Rodentibacter mrazii]QIA76144.1 hypothetical protein FEE42_01610 [Rodentibacter heylii]QIA76682.1 hypothetical protein FEE42_04580 [Rodentibacter heylii]